MAFKHILITFGIVGFAGWYTLGHYATKSEKMSPVEIEQHIKAGVSQIDASANQNLADWLHIEKMESGPDWFGFVATASRGTMPPECQGSDAWQTCIKGELLINFYCQYSDFALLPSSSLSNEINVTYEIHMDDQPAMKAFSGQVPFSACKGLKKT